jgi:hypothetical protein
MHVGFMVTKYSATAFESGAQRSTAGRNGEGQLGAIGVGAATGCVSSAAAASLT